MTRILVLYYSSWGHVETLAEEEAAGARSAGAEAVIKRVPELVPEEIARKSGYKLDQRAPIATVDELPEYDGILFGTPTRFGNMAAQMRNFLDQTGALWARGALIGKPAGVFTSSASQHWGQETTITSFHHTLLHQGMIVVGVPPSEKALFVLDQVSGGGPYGASTLAGADGSRQVSDNERVIARAQGSHLAGIAKRLSAG
jgi:NAD(P)H:quinone oxidoreductase, type IV